MSQLTQVSNTFKACLIQLSDAPKQTEITLNKMAVAEYNKIPAMKEGPAQTQSPKPRPKL